MTNSEVDPNYNPDPTADINIRINDLEERTNNTREKVNLISKNFIFVKEDFDEKILKIEKENAEIKKELNGLKRSVLSISQESEKWIRRDEIILIERMLKDFQPIEFVRKKDLEELFIKYLELNKREGLEKNKKPGKL
jgi:hypothetical protein